MEDSQVRLSPKASLASMEVSVAGVAVEVAGEAVVVVVLVETSEDRTMASEDAEVPEGVEEDLVAKVAPQLPNIQHNSSYFQVIGTMVLRLNKDLIILTSKYQSVRRVS